MSVKTSDFRIGIPLSDKERNEAVQFIEREMRKSFGCDPPPTTGVLCMAYLEETIVGSIAIQGTHGNAPFPIEHHYEFDTSTLSFSFERATTVQGSRWIAVKAGVSELVLKASFHLALALGKDYMLIEAKPYSIKRLGELGVVGEEIIGSKLLVENVREIVGESGLRYFTEPPLPILYMINLRKSVTSL